MRLVCNSHHLELTGPDLVKLILQFGTTKKNGEEGSLLGGLGRMLDGD